MAIELPFTPVIRSRRGRAGGRGHQSTRHGPYTTRLHRLTSPEHMESQSNTQTSSSQPPITGDTHLFIQKAISISSGKDFPPTIVDAKSLIAHPQLTNLCQTIRSAIPNNLRNLLTDTFLAALLETLNAPIPNELIYTSTFGQTKPYLQKATSLGLAELVLSNGDRTEFQQNNSNSCNLTPLFKYPAFANITETLVLVMQLGEISLIDLHRNIMSSIIIQRLSNHPS